MTSFMREPRRCFVCKTTCDYQILTSTNAFGSPDLDLRPPEMKRSTMMWWVHKCPVCGYVAPDVSDYTMITKKWLQTDRYKNCDGIDFTSELAKRFYQLYMISVHENCPLDAFFALLHAAWSCDDCEDVENATRCRKLALLHYDDALPIYIMREEEPRTIQVVKADIMRRAGLFEELKNEYQSIHLLNERFNQIIAFQLKKAAAGDRKCYTVEDAIGG